MLVLSGLSSFSAAKLMQINKKRKRFERKWVIHLVISQKLPTFAARNWKNNNIKKIQRWKEHSNPRTEREETSTVSVKEWPPLTVAAYWQPAAPKAARSWPSPTSTTAWKRKARIADIPRQTDKEPPGIAENKQRRAVLFLYKNRHVSSEQAVGHPLLFPTCKFFSFYFYLLILSKTAQDKFVPSSFHVRSKFVPLETKK